MPNHVPQGTRLGIKSQHFNAQPDPLAGVVGQQPFGGSRASGTNDKAGSDLNLQRWISIRTVKETFDTPKNYRYPFLQDD